MGAMALRPIDPAPGQRVLELGCGVGLVLSPIPADNTRLVGDTSSFVGE